MVNPHELHSGGKDYRTMAAVIACVATYGLMLGLAWPLLSLILESRGVSTTIIGLNAAMVSLGVLVFSPMVPRCMARLGARRFLVSCIVVEVVLFLSLPVFDSLGAWFVLRFFIGATGVGLFIAGETWINEIAAERSRGRVMGLYNAIMSGTVAIGPLILLVTGTAGWLPFLIGAGFIALAALPLVWADQAPRFENDAPAFGLLAFCREAPTLAGAVLLMSVMFMGCTALLPVYGIRVGIAPAEAPILLAVLLAGGVALQWPIGWMCDHMPRRSVLMFCVCGGALGAGLLPFTIATPAIWPLLFLWGGLFNSIYTVAMTMAGERFRGTKLAQAMASFGIIWGVGCLVGPGLGGLAMDLWAPHGFPGFLLLCCLCSVGLTMVRGLKGATLSNEH